MALGDQAGKVAVDTLVSQFPQLEGFIAGELQKLQQTLQSVVITSVAAAQEALGETLSDLTAERTETISDLHNLLSRLDGMTISLHIPALPEKAN